MTTMTKPEFTAYAEKLLANHAIVFSDEEDETTRHEVGSAAKELMCDVFNVEVSDLRVYLNGVELGALHLVNEYDMERECPVVTISNFTNGVKALIA